MPKDGLKWHPVVIKKKKRLYLDDTSLERVKKLKSSWQGVLETSIEYWERIKQEEVKWFYKETMQG